MSNPIGYIARDPEAVERWVLFHADGRPSNRWGRGDTLRDVIEAIEGAGMVVLSDLRVVRDDPAERALQEAEEIRDGWRRPDGSVISDRDAHRYP